MTTPENLTENVFPSSPKQDFGPRAHGHPWGTPTTLRIQSVIYMLPRQDFNRYLKGVAATARQAKAGRHFSSISLLLGDCSTTPLLTLDDVASIKDLLSPDIDDVQYWYFGENLGSAGGHNLLATSLDSEFLLILNPDTYCSPFVLNELLSHFADSSVGVVEARQIPIEHPKSYGSDGQTSWASTCCCLLRSEVFSDVQGFDSESFFLYCDDVDFSWRARLIGWKILFAPKAIVFHDKRLTNEGQVWAGHAEIYYAAEASLLMAWKYNRPDLADKYLSWFIDSPEPLHRKAAAEFLRRKSAESLPETLDPDHTVAEFVGTHFATHRFSYDD